MCPEDVLQIKKKMTLVLQGELLEAAWVYYWGLKWSIHGNALSVRSLIHRPATERSVQVSQRLLFWTGWCWPYCCRRSAQVNLFFQTSQPLDWICYTSMWGSWNRSDLYFLHFSAMLLTVVYIMSNMCVFMCGFYFIAPLIFFLISFFYTPTQFQVFLFLFYAVVHLFGNL